MSYSHVADLEGCGGYISPSALSTDIGNEYTLNKTEYQSSVEDNNLKAKY